MKGSRRKSLRSTIKTSVDKGRTKEYNVDRPDVVRKSELRTGLEDEKGTV